MRDSAPCVSCYLVEWYRDGLPQDAIDESFAMLSQGAGLLSDDGSRAEVVLMLSVPTDDLIFCVFSAASAEVVLAACARAGIPAERVTPAMVAA